MIFQFGAGSFTIYTMFNWYDKNSNEQFNNFLKYIIVPFSLFVERVVRTMHSMGPAVFYGGFSTFLAFILLAASQSYIFKTFFKVRMYDIQHTAGIPDTHCCVSAQYQYTFT